MSTGPFIVSPKTSVILASDLGLGETTADNPLFGYVNRTKDASIITDFSDPDHPETNLKTVSTAEKWKSTETYDQNIDIVLDSTRTIDYVGIAKHNLGSTTCGVAIWTALSLDSSGVPQYTEVVSETFLPDDGPALIRFTSAPLVAVRIALTPTAELPEIAVVYTGDLLIGQRRIYVGHTPLKYGREINDVQVLSVSGNFLGTVVLGETRVSDIQIDNMTAGWFRDKLDPFLEQTHGKRQPFFFAWRPSTYPNEVGYVWITDQPRPLNALPNGDMAISLRLRGIV